MKRYLTPSDYDRCYCSGNSECAFCLRMIAEAERPYGDCASEECDEPADSEGWCADCLDQLIHQYEKAHGI